MFDVTNLRPELRRIWREEKRRCLRTARKARIAEKRAFLLGC